MAVSVTVTNQGNTLRIYDYNTQIDLFKYLLAVSTSEDGLSVIFRYRNHGIKEYRASSFITPSGTATQIQAAISAMLKLT